MCSGERERDEFLLILPARKSGEKEERMEMMMVMRGCTWRGRLTGNWRDMLGRYSGGNNRKRCSVLCGT